MCFLNIVDCEFSFFNVMSDFLCRRERQFRVVIALKPDLYTLQQFLLRRHFEAPYEVIQVLDVVLRAAPSEKYLTLTVLIKVSLFVMYDIGCSVPMPAFVCSCN